MSRPVENQHNATVLKYGAICVTKDDLNCLEPKEYVNDNIINFWLNYMYETLLDTSQKERIHVCDTHFMLGLENLDEESPHKLQRRMKQFDKDFVVIPVNVCGNHWILVTWEYPCHAFNEESYNDLVYRSRLRFHDSMGQDYLPEEKTKVYKTLTNFIRKAIVSVKDDEPIADSPKVAVRHEQVYKQQNTYDCGIHLLTNAERFILMAFDKVSDDIVQDDFVVLLKTSRAKRVDIKKLICGLGDSQQTAEMHESQKTTDLS